MQCIQIDIDRALILSNFDGVRRELYEKYRSIMCLLVVNFCLNYSAVPSTLPQQKALSFSVRGMGL